MTTIQLDGDDCTYLLTLPEDSLPRVAYWGPRLRFPDPAARPAAQDTPVFQGGLDVPYQLNIFPEAGRGFKGSPALLGDRNGLAWANSFTLEDVQHQGQQVALGYVDHQAELQLRLELVLDAASNVLARRTTIVNQGDSPYALHYCAAAAMPVPAFLDQLIRFHGCWTGEFMTARVPFGEGIIQVDNRTGRTSHESFPALIACETGAANTRGRVWGMHLGWSGNWRCLAEQVADGSKQLQAGELFFPGEKVLAPGHSYVSPWAYGTCTDRGLNGLSKNFHDYCRSHIVPKNVATRPRPVQFNSWEAVYFRHDLDHLKSMADKAAFLGVERFVLDDGWFEGRDDDTRALGDWWPDPRKYPDGLGPLVEHVTGLGMEFGLWIEPEMINEESQLYRLHPDWVLNLPGIPLQRGRNQLVLDMSRPEVTGYLFDKFDALLADHDIAYIKWDMNRVLTEAGSQGHASVCAQTIGFYDLLDRLRAKHPTVEFESCASGGGRVDYMVMQRAERFWASDSNDPFRRLQIQQGASLFFPPEVIGSHIGPSTCHTTGRVTSLGFRAAVALGYHFGMECDLLALTGEEEQQLTRLIKLHKNHRALLHNGDYQRLDHLTVNRCGYGVVAKDKGEAIFFLHQTEIDGQSANRTVLLTGLDHHALYRVELLEPSDTAMINKRVTGPLADGPTHFTGDYLMHWGLEFYFTNPGSSAILSLTRI